MRVPKMWVAVGAVAFAAGCGDIGSKPSTNVSTGPGVTIQNSGTGPMNNSSFGGAGYDSGIDSGKTLDEVTGAEVAAACSNFESYIVSTIGEQEILEFSCNIQGFFQGFQAEDDAQAQMLCAQARDQCLAESQTLDIGCPIEDAEGCSDVTIAEVEACTNAQVKLVRDNADIFECSNASTNPEELQVIDQDIPECRPIQDCDDAVPIEGGGSDGSGGMTPPGGG